MSLWSQYSFYYVYTDNRKITIHIGLLVAILTGETKIRTDAQSD